MRWQTETQIPAFPFTINHNSQLLMLGSCFAENIGERLRYFKFNTVLNPFGIVYNPLSLLHTVQVLCGNKTYDEADLQTANGRFFSYDHHSRFSAASAEETLENINTKMVEARIALPKTDVVFISLGTSFYWQLVAQNRVVNNCHKQPGKLFEQKRASVEEVRSALTETVVYLKKVAPQIQVVFTISPIRHLKHGSAGNQLSKAALMVAAQELAEGMDNVYYFPSYELLLDDLRDYRWYEEDLIHPNKTAIDYIWERFSEVFFTKETITLNNQVRQIQNLLAHRLFATNEADAKKVLTRLTKLIEESKLDFTKELASWKKKWIPNQT